MSGAAAALGALLGRVDVADAHSVRGWAAHAGQPGAVVALELLLDGAPLGVFEAGHFRADLAAAGIGSGHHAFAVTIPGGLSLHADRVLVLRRAADGAVLPGSPVVLRRAALSGAVARRAVSDAVAAAAAGAEPAALEALMRLLVAEIAARETVALPHHAALIERWGGAAVAPVDAGRPRALVIDEAIPDPGRDAGSSAILSHMQALRRLGFDVEFVPAFSLVAGPDAGERLVQAGFQPWLAPWVGSVEEVLRRGGDGYGVVYVHRLGVMRKYAALIRRWCPSARLVYCVADLHHLRAARQAAVAAGVALADSDGDAAFAGDGELRASELAAIRSADATLTHSPYEQALLARVLPDVPVHVVPWEVALGAPAVAAEARAGVGFVGSFGHPPNGDAAYELLEVVMPLVWAQDRSIPCVLAGSDMPAGLRAAAAAAGGPVELLGHIPSLATLWGRVLLAAAPLRFGAGIKGKVLDSLAAGIPCLCSPIAAEGLALPAELEALVQDGPAAMADAIVRLHGDRAAVARLGAAGQAYIAARNGAGVVDAALAAALGAMACGVTAPA